MTRVEWTHTVETSRLLRALAAVGLGATVGVFGLLAALAVFVVGASVLAGEFAVLGLLLALGLLGARRLAAHGALVREEGLGVSEFVPPRLLVVAGLAWVVVLGGLTALDVPSRTVFALVVVAVVASLPTVALLSSEGSVDTDAGVLDADGGDASLASVKRVRSYDLGRVALVHVHYHDGTGASAPRLLTVPAEQADAVRRALESSDAVPPESDRNPLVAKTLYAFAVGALALGTAAGVWAVTVGGDAAVVGWYGAAFAVVFAGLFAWLGAVES